MAPYSLNSILHNICSLGTNLCQLFFFLRSLVALTTLNPPPRQTLDYNRKQTNMAVHCPAKSGRICQDPGVSQRGDPCMFGPQKEIWITSTSAKSSGNVNWGPGLFKESISVCFWMEASCLLQWISPTSTQRWVLNKLCSWEGTGCWLWSWGPTSAGVWCKCSETLLHGNTNPYTVVPQLLLLLCDILK